MGIQGYLREFVDASDFLWYAKQVIVPELKTKRKEGHISEWNYQGVIKDIKAGMIGSDPKAKILDDFKDSATAGYLIESRYDYGKGMTLNHILKKLPEDENFRRSITTNRDLGKHLIGTEYEGAIPDIKFNNKSRKLEVSAAPYGISLQERLEGLCENGKMIALTKAIDDYIGLFAKMNDINSFRNLNFGKHFLDSNAYFKENYSSSKTLVDAFSENIGNHLNAEKGDNIHGNLLPSRILVDDRYNYIDWAWASSDGFFEHDLGLLLGASEIGPELESRLVSYASKRLHTDPAEANRSVVTYHKNKAMMELIDSRYLMRKASDTTNDAERERLFNLSGIAFNDSIRRQQELESYGMIRRSFINMLIDSAPGIGFNRISYLNDADLEDMRSNHGTNYMRQKNDEIFLEAVKDYRESISKYY